MQALPCRAALGHRSALVSHSLPLEMQRHLHIAPTGGSTYGRRALTVVIVAAADCGALRWAEPVVLAGLLTSLYRAEQPHCERRAMCADIVAFGERSLRGGHATRGQSTMTSVRVRGQGWR